VSSIGKRAAQAIESKAKENGREVSEELKRIGASRKNLSDWRKKGRNPQAYYLQQMALHGYDIYYILLGETK
jgi:hypothetical protein